MKWDIFVRGFPSSQDDVTDVGWSGVEKTSQILQECMFQNQEYGTETSTPEKDAITILQRKQGLGKGYA